MKKLIVPFLALAALLTACAPEEIGASFADIKAEPSYVSIDKDGGSKEVVITATDKWNITNIPEWLTIEPATSGEKGKHTLTLSALKTYEAHSVELKVTVGKYSQTILVEQSLGDDLSITKVKDFLESGVDGTTYALQGVIGKVTNTDYGNFYLNDGTVEGDGAYIYGMLDANGGEKNFLSLGINEGDEIVLSGPRKTYSGTVEIVNATLIKVVTKALLGAEKKSFTVKNGAGELKVPVSVKGEDLTVDVPEADWLKFEGVEGSGEDTEVIMSFTANETGAPREADFVLTSFKKAEKKGDKDVESKLTISVKQIPAFPEAKKASEINYSGYEYVAVEGQIAALTTSGFVLCDGSENEVNKVLVKLDGFDYSKYQLGYKVKALGEAKVDSKSMNMVTADTVQTVETTGKYVHPAAVVIDDKNSAEIMAINPAKYGYYGVTGLVSDGGKTIVIANGKQAVSAIDAPDTLALKAYAGKYVTVNGYHASNYADNNQIQLVLTSLKTLDKEPAFLEIPANVKEKKDTISWNEDSFEFEVLSNQEWKASITKALNVEEVYTSITSGKGSKDIEIIFGEKNNSYDDQTVEITVTAGELSRKYVLVRTGKVLEIELDKTEYTNQAQTILLNVKASKFWKIAVDGNATLDKAEGMGDGVVVMKISKNETGADVVYKVTLTEDRVEGTAHTDELEIKHLAIAGVATVGQGTEESPYTPKDALDLMAANFHDEAAEVYIAGVIAKIDDYNYTNFGNATYYISADGTETDMLYVYRGKSFDGEKFNEPDQIRVGDKIVINGKLTVYKNSDGSYVQPQVNKDSKIVELESAEVLFDVDPKSVSLETEAGTFDIAMLCKNVDYEINPSADWVSVKGISTTDGENYVVTFSYAANTDPASRTATIDFVSNEQPVSVEVTQNGNMPDTEGEGTEASPYTAADVIAIVNAGANDNTVEVYVKGIVSEFKEINTKYSSVYYYISVDGTTENQLYVYSGKGIDGAAVTESSPVKVGDQVVILGKMTDYKGTPQIDMNSKIVSLIPSEEETTPPSEGETTPPAGGGQ